MAPDNPGDLKAAQSLLDVLYTLNSLDPDNVAGVDGVYAGDNTFDVLRNPALSMSPYTHVRTALLFSLTRLCDGSRSRAEQVLETAYDNGDSVARALERLRETVWTEPDPVEDAVAALFEHARTSEEYDVLTRLVAAAGLRWDCAECGATEAASKDVCEHCTTARPTS